MKHEQSQGLFAAAGKYIPGGVNSPVRAFGRVGGTPLFITQASGANIRERLSRLCGLVGSDDSGPRAPDRDRRHRSGCAWWHQLWRTDTR